MAARARVGSDMWGRCGIRRARGTRWAGADNLCRRSWWAVWSWARRAGNWWAVGTRALRPWMRNWWAVRTRALIPWVRNWWADLNELGRVNSRIGQILCWSWESYTRSADGRCKGSEIGTISKEADHSSLSGVDGSC